MVRSHPPEAVADERLFRPRRTAVAGEWKLDLVGEEYRARRVEWSENETESVPLDAVPAHARERLEDAIDRTVPTGDRSADESGEGEQSPPEGVEANLRALGYP